MAEREGPLLGSRTRFVVSSPARLKSVNNIVIDTAFYKTDVLWF